MYHRVNEADTHLLGTFGQIRMIYQNIAREWNVKIASNGKNLEKNNLDKKIKPSKAESIDCWKENKRKTESCKSWSVLSWHWCALNPFAFHKYSRMILSVFYVFLHVPEEKLLFDMVSLKIGNTLLGNSYGFLRNVFKFKKSTLSWITHRHFSDMLRVVINICVFLMADYVSSGKTFWEN